MYLCVYIYIYIHTSLSLSNGPTRRWLASRGAANANFHIRVNGRSRSAVRLISNG